MPPPTVSVLLPALDEEQHLAACLSSLLSEPYPGLLEILVLDGGSADRTREVAAGFGPPVRVVDNPRRTTAAALNTGLALARGEIIVRADAHTTYERGYLRRCVEVLLETGADNVGGPVRPVATTAFGRAVVAVTTSAAGVGPGRATGATGRQEVDTVPFGCWRRVTLEGLGGYDERMVGAEDDELNLRLRQAGGRVVSDPDLRYSYVARQTVSGLARQYAGYGSGKACVLVTHRTLPNLRPLAPAALVGFTALLALTGHRRATAAVALLHTAFVIRFSRALVTATEDVRARDAAAAMAVCHWAYGVGFWRGLLRAVVRHGAGGAPGRAVAPP